MITSPPHLSLPFPQLLTRIQNEATVLDEQIIKIDHFLNHRIEPSFMTAMGREIAARLAVYKPDLVLTAEASGIAPGLVAAIALDVPLVYAKKYAPMIEPPAYSRIVPSPTKGGETRLVIGKRYLWAGARVVIVDDILSNGRTSQALIEMVREAQAEVFAAAFIMEKRFKNGREMIEALDVPVATLAQVARIEAGKVIMAGQ
ncbi:phosphoribosyltransferase family protein [Niveibacterium sp. 24ML]|uniref:phosphoribosyltransferase family protein n=1 Tax=Niveibacterium sp. 24ML TaxID=2985512 RepID=UPI0022702DAC|nr:phosphoribosyltransferase family protein [Niveibacterium sp. 24ML]MCX9154967.1 phosphoribosyltransferase family protein [Niveibacterium sp. 24ML]